MRTFIGIEFDRELKSRLSVLQNMLKGTSVKGRWKHSDSFHLTLKFLGETSPSKIEQIGILLRELNNFGSFSLMPGKLGQFKGRDNIRVLWLGLDGDTDKLQSLQKKVDCSMEGLGFEGENRPYTPHITLAQDLYSDSGFQYLQEAADGFDFPRLWVDRIHLFCSEQIGNKRVYTSIKKFLLN